MPKVIPILPCFNIKEQAKFYEALGFEVVEIFTSPNAYAVLKYEELELHFWGSKRNVPEENPSMWIIKVGDVDTICDKFTQGLKEVYGKIPRSGIPKITKVRELKEDRRFTLTDTGGNTLYVMSLNNETINLRMLEEEKYAKDFAILYDLVYSKEDKKVASKMLSNIIKIKNDLNDKDKAKFLLLEIEIKGLVDEEVNDALKYLIDNANPEDPFWNKVKNTLEKIITENKE